MTRQFYETIHRNFCEIRLANSGFAESDAQFINEKFANAIENLKYAKTALTYEASAYSDLKENNLLLIYCIDTMLEIIDEGNQAKIFDFADAVHNIPGIFTEKWNIESFSSDMNAFRKKYGYSYFPDWN